MKNNTDLITKIGEKYNLVLYWFTPYHVRVWPEDMSKRFDFFVVSGKIQFDKKKFTRPRLEEWVVMVFHL